jgi:hypothetical protein
MMGWIIGAAVATISWIVIAKGGAAASCPSEAATLIIFNWKEENGSECHAEWSKQNNAYI